MRHFLMAVAAALAASAAVADTYILPISGRGSALWYQRVSVLNPNAEEVTVRVVRALPMQVDGCVRCPASATITVPPQSLRTWDVYRSSNGDLVQLGAFELESTAPVVIHAMYFTFAGHELRQKVDLAREWLPAGVHQAPVEWGVDVRTNAILTNPNDFDIEVALWLPPRGENEIRVTVPAGRTTMVPVPRAICGGAPCVFPPEYPPRPQVITFESAAPFLGSVSVIGPSWTAFALAGAE